MPDTEIFDMPMELSLELMTVIGADLADTERELIDDVIDKVDRVGLCMLLVDLERANAGGIVSGGILVAPNLLALPFSMKVRNLTSIWM